MSDNVAITPGSGATVAADLIGGALHQRVKLSLGADGTAADAPGDGTNGLDVDVTRMAALVAGEAHAAEVGGNLITVAVSFTRPGDTTAYAAGDAVNNSTSAPTIMTFANAGRVAAGSGYVVGCRLQKSTVTTANAVFRLHLYHTTVTMINDNTAQTVLYANATKRIGAIDLSCGSDGSDGAEAQDFSLRIPYKCDGGATDIFGVLQAKGAYAPGNAEQFTIELSLDRN